MLSYCTICRGIQCFRDGKIGTENKTFLWVNKVNDKNTYILHQRYVPGFTYPEQQLKNPICWPSPAINICKMNTKSAYGGSDETEILCPRELLRMLAPCGLNDHLILLQETRRGYLFMVSKTRALIRHGLVKLTRVSKSWDRFPGSKRLTPFYVVLMAK